MSSKRKTPRHARPDDDASFDDPRVIAALKQYEAALQSGKPPARREFLAQHADIADALIPCLAGLELVHQAAAHMRRDAGDPPRLTNDPLLAIAAELIPFASMAH